MYSTGPKGSELVRGLLSTTYSLIAVDTLSKISSHRCTTATYNTTFNFRNSPYCCSFGSKQLLIKILPMAWSSYYLCFCNDMCCQFHNCKISFSNRPIYFIIAYTYNTPLIRSFPVCFHDRHFLSSLYSACAYYCDSRC